LTKAFHALGVQPGPFKDVGFSGRWQCNCC
jgi:hypothetical protein